MGAVCVIDVDGSATRLALRRYFSTSGYAVLERDALLSDEHCVTATVVCADIDKIAAYAALQSIDPPKLILAQSHCTVETNVPFDAHYATIEEHPSLPGAMRRFKPVK